MTIALRQRPLARVVAGIVQAAQGCWLDPSDMTTLYQDAAGTTPVTAVEQPVGLMLDKSRVLMLGPELVSIGTFDSDTGWTKSGTWAISGGVASATTESGTTYQNAGLQAGKCYKFTFEIKSASAGVFAVGVGGNTISYWKSSVGVYTGFGYTKGNPNIELKCSGFTGTIDNISVRELYGYHATQSVTASRPVLSARKNILLATETLATQSVTTLASQYTLSFTGTGSVTLSGTATGTLTGTGSGRASLTFTPSAGTLTLTVSGSVTKAQLELGASAGPYQRVNTATDYDTDERYFPKYLRFDGIDDYMNLPYMGLYANGSVSVVMAGRTSAQWGVVISEGSTTSGSPQFAPLLTTTETGDTLVVIRDDNNGNVLLHYTPSMFDKVSVVSSIISASDSKAYRDSVFKTALSYTRSTPVTMNTTAIGARVSTSVVEFFGGNIYGLIITKSALTDAQRIACERHLSRKAGVVL